MSRTPSSESYSFHHALVLSAQRPLDRRDTQLETQAVAYSRDIPDATPVLPADASRHPNLVLQREVLEERGGLRVSRLPRSSEVRDGAALAGGGREGGEV